MKLQIVSDLHLEFHKRQAPGYTGIAPAPDADVLIIAGDIALNAAAVAPFSTWPVPVIYVAGNHEHYGGDITRVQRAIRQACEGTAVRFLEREETMFDGVRFLGTTLWTDYLLYGREKQRAAMQAAEECLNDHGSIRLAGKRFLAKDALYRHVTSRNWLQEKLAEPFAGKTVVITHHAPHPQSVHEKYQGDLLSAAFVSDLTPFLGHCPLWVHGHVHDSFDYVMHGTRVVANPRGYPVASGSENGAFDPSLVVEV